MLRVAPDASTPERLLDDLYPGGFLVAEWEKCDMCDQDVDGYIYLQSRRRGFCAPHYDLVRNGELPF